MKRHFRTLLAASALLLWLLSSCAGNGCDAASPAPVVTIGSARAPEPAPPEGPNARREAWLHRRRAYPASRVPAGAYRNARTAWQKLTRVRRSDTGALRVVAVPSSEEGLPKPLDAGMALWKFLGPAPLDTTKGPYAAPNMSPAGGRASAIAIDPTDASTLYVGYAIGGVWKSTDAGETFSPLMDDQPSLAVGAITLDPNEPGTVWVGTGEPAMPAGHGGRGLLRSKDGGATWKQFGADLFDGLAISRVVLDGTDLYVTAMFGAAGAGTSCQKIDAEAVGQGVYKSSDGGATFVLLKKGSMVDLAVDVSVMPRRILASDSLTGVWKSSDGGSTWAQPTGLPIATGNPKARRIELAVAPTDAAVVYAGFGVGGKATVSLSTDFGETFAEIPGAPNYCEGQCHYDNTVVVDPTDANVVYLGGGLCAVWKTTDALSAAPTWANVSLPDQDCGAENANWNKGHVHPDIHAITIDPKAPSVVYAASDGGLARTKDGGGTWERLNEGVGTIQLYGICAHPTDPEIVYGGSQDNGSMKRTSDGVRWLGLISGDGGPCAVNEANPDVVLITNNGGVVLRSKNGFKNFAPQYVFSADPSYCTAGAPGCGDRTAFIAPLVADPVAHGTFYIGTYRLWKSDADGASKSWEAISQDLTAGKASVDCATQFIPNADDALSAIAPAPSAPGTIYTGSQAGLLHVTTDGGGAWTKVSKAPLPGRFLSAIAVDPVDAKTVYAAFSGFSSTTPATPGHVFVSTNGGETWTVRDVGTDAPVDTLIAHPVARGLLYAGTDLGVIVTTDGGMTWNVLGDDLPNVAVSSLAFRRSDTTLIAGTFGRSAWSTTFTGALSVVEDDLSFTAEVGKPNPASLAMTAVDDDVYGSIVDFTVTTDAAWVTVDPPSGRVAGATGTKVAVSVASSELKIGEYDATLSVTSSNGGGVVKVPVHLSVRAPEPKTPKPKATAADEGCGCRSAGAPTSDAQALVVLAVAALVTISRRRAA